MTVPFDRSDENRTDASEPTSSGSTASTPCPDMGRETIACTGASSAPIPVRVVLVTAIPPLTQPPLFGPGRPYPGAGSFGL